MKILLKHLVRYTRLLPDCIPFTCMLLSRFNVEAYNELRLRDLEYSDFRACAEIGYGEMSIVVYVTICQNKIKGGRGVQTPI